MTTFAFRHVSYFLYVCPRCYSNAICSTDRKISKHVNNMCSLHAYSLVFQIFAQTNHFLLRKNFVELFFGTKCVWKGPTSILNASAYEQFGMCVVCFAVCPLRTFSLFVHIHRVYLDLLVKIEYDRIPYSRTGMFTRGVTLSRANTIP